MRRTPHDTQRKVWGHYCIPSQYSVCFHRLRRATTVYMHRWKLEALGTYFQPPLSRESSWEPNLLRQHTWTNNSYMDECSCYAWFNFVRLPQQVTLHDVGRLNTDARMPKSSKAFIAAWCGCVALRGGRSPHLQFSSSQKYYSSKLAP